MKVGDLVVCFKHEKYEATVVGAIIERVSDIDPNYFAWRVLLHDEIQVVHESFLEVVK